MVATKDLAFSYPGGTQLKFPDIAVPERGSLLITGGSGSGKTTLLHLLGGLLQPETGRISIADTVISNLNERALDKFRGKNIGIVLQEPHFIASLDVLDNVLLAGYLATGKMSHLEGKEILGQLGLGDQIHKLPSKLSIGQQQRVSIARALINRPALLLADEPTSSLDDANAVLVSEMLTELSVQSGSSLIIVTHDQRLKDRFEKNIAL